MLSIIGMGYCHPTNVIDNKFIEALDVGTSEEWILEKIGIETRVTTLPLDYIRETRNQDPRQALSVATMSATQLGAKASEMALERAGIKASQVGLVICNCCSPSKIVPTEGQRVAQALGIIAPAYDVLSACPAFALHIDFLNNFKDDKLPEYVLCISTATITHNVNYNDRSDSAIWGDGAAAWVVSSRHHGKLRVLDSFYTTDPSRCDSVVIERYGFFHQDGRAVRDFSVRQTVRLIKRMESIFPMNWEHDIFVGHQANATMLQQIVNNRKIPASNHWHNVTFLGNQAAAGAPSVIAMHWDEIKDGQKIAVAVVGAGLSWGSVLFEAV